MKHQCLVDRVIFLLAGVVGSWLIATIWYGDEVSRSRQLPFIVQAYERRMSREQINAVKADMKLAADTAGDCLSAQIEGSRNECRPEYFLP